MSTDSSTPTISQQQLNLDEDDQMAVSQPQSSSQSFDPATVFMKAYECAKNNSNWNKVLSSLMIHPEWLTRIPQGRKWTMLHQIVYSGNVRHLNEVLALQTTNQAFRLLHETLNHKTVRDVATTRALDHPQMMQRIERLITLDQLLDNAKACNWKLLREFIRQQPDIVNEKPPYRRYYLAHHLAYMGQLDIFKDLSNICQFQLDLLSSNKTIEQVARERNHIEFAEYIKSLHPNANQMVQTNQITSHHPPSILTTTDTTQENTYEQSITDSLNHTNKANLLNTITCSITKDVFHDPVMASDGFTYEREAILNWFRHSNRSPMTNEELDNLEIKPNYAIKSIIQSLQNDNH